LSAEMQVNSYKDLVRKTSTPSPAAVGAESELDSLINTLKERKAKRDAERAANQAEKDPVSKLREQIRNELIAEVRNLAAKYSKAGIRIRFDPSNLMGGGREVTLELAMEGNRTELRGIVTNEAIAFSEIRYSSGFSGEMVSGPSLRLRHLTVASFRAFLCERLMILIRTFLAHRR